MYDNIESSEQIRKRIIDVLNEFRSSDKTNFWINKSINDLYVILNVNLPKKESMTRDSVETLEKSKEALYLASFEYTLNGMISAQAIFAKHAENAMKSSKEYDYPAFSDGMRRGYNDPRLITVTPSKSGFKCKVVINMDKVYGKLENYGKAITSARESQKVGTGEIMNASLIWADKIYALAREGGMRKSKKYSKYYEGNYAKTIGLRVAQFVGLAPWWKLLDKGNVSNLIPGNSRAGGGANTGNPYPEVIATNFVDKTRSEIKLSLEYLWKSQYNMSIGIVDTIIKELTNDLLPLRKLATQITRIIEHLRTLYTYSYTIRDVPAKSSYATPKLKSLTEDMTKVVVTRMSLRKNFSANIEKLKVLSNRILKYYYETGAVPTSVRGGGYRTRTIVIVREFEQILKELSR